MSGYAIIEINNNAKDLVKFIEDKADFLNYIKSKLLIEYTLLENLSYNDFTKSKTFKPGKYLLVNENKALYIEKDNIITRGIVYNGSRIEFKIISEWELIPITADLNDFKKEKFEGFESAEALVIAKFDMLAKIKEMTLQGIKFSQTYDINSSYKTMKYEYDLLNKIIEEQLYEQLDADLVKMQMAGDEIQEYSETDVGYYYDNVPGTDSYEQITNTDLPEFGIISMIGKRGVGKSTAVCNILDKYTQQFITNSLIICPTERMNPMYKYKYPTAKVMSQYQPELIEEFLQYGPGAIVFDDCLHSKGDWLNDEALMELLYNAKAYHKLVIVVMQFPLKFSSELRNEFDYIMIFSEASYSNQKRLYEHYASMFQSFDSFRETLMQLTYNYNCMALNMRWKENFNDRICWFNANPKEKQD